MGCLTMLRYLNLSDWVGVVVIALLLLIIISALLPAFWGVRQQRVLADCMNNVRTLVQMCYMYAFNNDGKFPDSFNTLAGAGYTIGNLTSCPTVKGKADYGFNSAATMDCPSDTPFIGDFDSSNHNDEGGNIGYVDGSTRWYDGEHSAGSGPLENVSPEDWVRE